MGRFEWRNHGCRGLLVQLEGYETLILENELLRTSWLVGRGTDIVEFLHKPTDTDFLYRSPRGIINHSSFKTNVQVGEGNLLDVYEGCWQEILPCAAVDSYKGAQFGAFGEACLLPWDWEILEDSVSKVAVRFTVRLLRAPLLLEKIVEIRKGQAAIHARETLVNVGGESYDLVWGHHVAIGEPFLDDSCLIEMPEGSEVFTTPLMEDELYAEYGQCATPPGKTSSWPFFPDAWGGELDLSRPLEKGRYSWVYVSNLQAGWFGVSSGSKGVGFGMAWDKTVFPCLCLWQENYGRMGYPNWGRERNVTIDPSNSVLESISTAVERGDQITLPPNGSLDLQWVALAYEPRGGRVRNIGLDGVVDLT